MEFIAVFVWLSLTLALCWLVHVISGSTRRYVTLKFLVLPGMIVRKYSMAATIMLTGGRITRGEAYSTAKSLRALRARWFRWRPCLDAPWCWPL